MGDVPERLADLAQQTFHDALCPNVHPHNRIACSLVGGPILDVVDAALESVLADLRRQVQVMITLTEGDRNRADAAGDRFLEARYDAQRSALLWMADLLDTTEQHGHVPRNLGY